MQELIQHFIDAPLPNLCVLSGLVFLVIAVVGNISGKIQPDKAGRIAAGILGLFRAEMVACAAVPAQLH
jgi:hypothetical protein